MAKSKGGLYIWRTRKPHAIIGLPIIGRHFGYAGMTNSFYHRQGQHLNGSLVYGRTPASWSDLEPKCYQIPLPRFILHGHYRRKITFTLETLLIWLTCPVYNDKQQPPYNIRKISRRKAAMQRAARDEHGRWYTGSKFVVRWIIYAALVAAVFYFYTHR